MVGESSIAYNLAIKQHYM